MLDNPDTGGDDWSPASTLYGRDNGCDVSRGPYIVLVDMMKVDTRCKEVRRGYWTASKNDPLPPGKHFGDSGKAIGPGECLSAIYGKIMR